MKFRFLATDLDGTLLTSDKAITPRTLEVLVGAQERGLTVILASGRPLHSILPFARQLELNKYRGYVIAYNGSVIWDCAAGKAIKEQTIPQSLIPQLAAMVPAGFHIHGYKEGSIVVQGVPDEWSRYIARANRMPLLETGNFVKTITDPQHKCIITGSPRRLWHLEKSISKRFENCLSVCRSESFLLEIMPKGVDKAEALQELLSLLGGKAEELLCCGDGYNDLGMLRLAGLSCATRNANRSVRQVASFVTASNDRDGVACAVERYC